MPETFFKRDDKVVIYFDPGTEFQKEEEATLLELIRKDDNFETWKVRFLKHGDICERKIMLFPGKNGMAYANRYAEAKDVKY